MKIFEKSIRWWMANCPSWSWGAPQLLGSIGGPFETDHLKLSFRKRSRKKKTSQKYKKRVVIASIISHGSLQSQQRKTPFPRNGRGGRLRSYTARYIPWGWAGMSLTAAAPCRLVQRVANWGWPQLGVLILLVSILSSILIHFELENERGWKRPFEGFLK